MIPFSSYPLFALVVAGGSGSRMQSSLPKQFLPLQGRPVLMHTLQAFASLPAAVELVLVLPEGQLAYWQQLCREHHFSLPHQLVAGGSSRFQSVRNGLAQVPDQALVAIHDGVRPLIEREVIENAYALAAEKGSAVVAVALKDSIRHVQANGRSQSVPRQEYRLVQTPQTFRAGAIRRAYAQQEQPHFTDCASVAEAAGLEIHLVEGSYLNLKITTPEDLLLAEALLQGPHPQKP